MSTKMGYRPERRHMKTLATNDGMSSRGFEERYDNYVRWARQEYSDESRTTSYTVQNTNFGRRNVSRTSTVLKAARLTTTLQFATAMVALKEVSRDVEASSSLEPRPNTYRSDARPTRDLS
jgi:hypothetical protein